MSILCCLLALVSLGCVTRPAAIEPDDPLFGTWVNEEYDKLGKALIAKFVIRSDGSELDYECIAAAEPLAEGQNTIERKWTDAAGDRWYRIRYAWRPYSVQEWEGEEFVLVRVSADGTVMELNVNRFGFLEELDLLDPEYRTFFKLPQGMSSGRERELPIGAAPSPPWRRGERGMAPCIACRMRYSETTGGGGAWAIGGSATSWPAPH